MRAVVGLSGTRIVIAHRLSTLRHADVILRIEEGGVVRKMTFSELMHETEAAQSG
jgi:ATP-binding cassette, subfamily B, bacterial